MSAGKYQNEEEALRWKKADPIPRFEKMLSERGATSDQLQSRRERAKLLTDEALQFAIQSADPKAETVGNFVFAT